MNPNVNPEQFAKAFPAFAHKVQSNETVPEDCTCSSPRSHNEYARGISDPKNFTKTNLKGGAQHNSCPALRRACMDELDKRGVPYPAKWRGRSN